MEWIITTYVWKFIYCVRFQSSHDSNTYTISWWFIYWINKQFSMVIIFLWFRRLSSSTNLGLRLEERDGWGCGVDENYLHVITAPSLPNQSNYLQIEISSSLFTSSQTEKIIKIEHKQSVKGRGRFSLATYELWSVKDRIFIQAPKNLISLHKHF